MNAAARSKFSARQLAVGLAGYCAFINLYSPQSILPLLSQEFGAGAAQVSTIITVSTLAVAITAPFTGTVADVLGRKRVIVTAMFLLVVPTVMVGLSESLPALIFWRAVQGLVLPPIFAVTVAYIGDEWPANEATTAAGIYSSGSSLGGFSGRMVTGVIADLIGWRAGFGFLAAIAFAGAFAVLFLLPPERKFVRSEGLIASGRQMFAHLRNGRLLAIYAVGFGVLFNFICTFTFISFYLAAAPYNLSATWLGLRLRVRPLRLPRPCARSRLSSARNTRSDRDASDETGCKCVSAVARGRPDTIDRLRRKFSRGRRRA